MMGKVALLETNFEKALKYEKAENDVKQAQTDNRKVNVEKCERCLNEMNNNWNRYKCTTYWCQYGNPATFWAETLANHVGLHTGTECLSYDGSIYKKSSVAIASFIFTNIYNKCLSALYCEFWVVE